MVVITKNFFPFKFTLFVLISSNIAFSHGARTHGNKNYHLLHSDSLWPKPNCSDHKSGPGTHKMILSHVHGPCSPLANSVQTPSSHEILLKNEARVAWINSRISNPKSLTTMDESDAKSVAIAANIGEGAQYLTTIGLGTPAVDYKVMIDTGSDYTWVRCEGCKEGCISESPLFDPSKSSSYLNVSEEFSMNYGDDSKTIGVWSRDKLTLEPNNVINSFKFGCGLNIIDKAGDGNFANSSGVLALGSGDDSLVSQSASTFGKIFGYCLRNKNSEGYLLFGDEARKTASRSTLQFTALLPKNSLYVLQLDGISVGGNRLNVASETYGKTVIDSGTVVTHLPGKAYEALSSAFKQSMSAYQRAVAPKNEVLDTCFTVQSGQSIKFPSVTFHFAGGTDVDLDESGIGWASKEEKIWCLGFTKTENEGNPTIIGNTQQREMEVVYDIAGGKIGFGKNGCAE